MKKYLSILLSVLLLCTMLPLGAISVLAEGGPSYTINNGEVTITNGGDQGVMDVIIPATIAGYPVTAIGEYAYAGFPMESVTIPDTVTTIGSAAFRGCGGLQSVNMGKNVAVIGSSAFSNCYILSSIVLPDSVVTIENYAFGACLNLQSVTIPANVTTIGKGVFDECYNLTDVYYGGSEADHELIEIDSANNDALINATWHYNYINPKDLYSDTVTHSVMDTEYGTGLAFRFELSANGIGVKNRCEADLTNATINYLGTICKVVGMGAVMSNVEQKTMELIDVNGTNTIDVPVVYLQDLEPDSCQFAVRIINIPDTQLECTIYARPYYIVEVADEQITIYGDTNSAACIDYL